MDVVVFGAGSLGSLVGGLLARVHSVTLVGRDPHTSAVAESGLRVTGAFDFSARPDAVTDGTGLSADLAVVTVKSFDTAAAARDLATGEFDAALSLQNGMGNEDALAAQLDCPILAGTTTYGAVLREPGVVECTGVGDVALGPSSGGESPVAEWVGDAFRAADITVDVAADMPRRQWEKLAVNAGINAVTALARVPNGAVTDGPAHDIAAEAARETVRVARASGISLTDAEAVDALDRVAAATADNESSMRQDVERERRTEVDAIHGYVRDRATEAGVDAPVNRTLAGLLEAWESSCGLR